LKIVSEFQTER